MVFQLYIRFRSLIFYYTKKRIADAGINKFNGNYSVTSGKKPLFCKGMSGRVPIRNDLLNIFGKLPCQSGD